MSRIALQKKYAWKKNINYKDNAAKEENDVNTKVTNFNPHISDVNKNTKISSNGEDMDDSFDLFVPSKLSKRAKPLKLEEQHPNKRKSPYFEDEQDVKPTDKESDEQDLNSSKPYLRKSTEQKRDFYNVKDWKSRPKKICSVPLLMRRTKEERETILTEKVAMVLMNTDKDPMISSASNLLGDVLHSIADENRRLWTISQLNLTELEQKSFFVDIVAKSETSFTQDSCRIEKVLLPQDRNEKSDMEYSGDTSKACLNPPKFQDMERMESFLNDVAENTVCDEVDEILQNIKGKPEEVTVIEIDSDVMSDILSDTSSVILLENDNNITDKSRHAPSKQTKNEENVNFKQNVTFEDHKDLSPPLLINYYLPPSTSMAKATESKLSRTAKMEDFEIRALKILSHDFDQLYDLTSSYNIVIKLNHNKSFTTHSCILLARCPLLLEKVSYGSINWEEYNLTICQAFFKYIYSGKIHHFEHLSRENLQFVYDICCKYQITLLKEIIFSLHLEGVTYHDSFYECDNYSQTTLDPESNSSISDNESSKKVHSDLRHSTVSINEIKPEKRPSSSNSIEIIKEVRKGSPSIKLNVCDECPAKPTVVFLNVCLNKISGYLEFNHRPRKCFSLVNNSIECSSGVSNAVNSYSDHPSNCEFSEIGNSFCDCLHNQTSTDYNEFQEVDIKQFPKQDQCNQAQFLRMQCHQSLHQAHKNQLGGEDLHSSLTHSQLVTSLSPLPSLERLLEVDSLQTQSPQAISPFYSNASPEMQNLEKVESLKSKSENVSISLKSQNVQFHTRGGEDAKNIKQECSYFLQIPSTNTNFENINYQKSMNLLPGEVSSPFENDQHCKNNNEILRCSAEETPLDLSSELLFQRTEILSSDVLPSSEGASFNKPKRAKVNSPICSNLPLKDSQATAESNILNYETNSSYVNNFMQDSFPAIEDIMPTLSVNNLGEIDNSSTPSNKRPFCETPGGDVVCIKENVTPSPHYNEMSTPMLKRQLPKYGLKGELVKNKKAAISLLQYIYGQTHPTLAKEAISQLGDKQKESSSPSTSTGYNSSEQRRAFSHLDVCRIADSSDSENSEKQD